MCGVAGILSVSGELEPGDGQIRKMLGSITHRGPDSEGIWQDTHICLGHRRLAIVDLDPRSNQPMISACGRYIMIYNGEIYNHKTLRQQLEAVGHSFRTSSDSEVVLNAFIQWREGCLERLDGMFALAIWDCREKQLFLARDRFGEKPLLYFQEGGQFVFASELKALLKHERCPTGINQQALRDYLELGYCLTANGFIKNVHKLPAAHFMRVDADGEMVIRRYWDCTDFARLPKEQYKSLDDAAEAMAGIMKSSVDSRLFADVPVGIFLSGGIDSSLILLAARKWLGRDAVDTFSAGFREKGYSEVEQARQTAETLGTRHHELYLDLDKLPSDLDRIVAAGDEPFADTSMVPTYFLSQFTRQTVTVSLSGDAGDELFAGYETYVADLAFRKLGWVPSQIFGLIEKAMGAIPAGRSKIGPYYKARAFLRGASNGSSEAAHWAWRRICLDQQIGSLVRCDGSFTDHTSSSFTQISPILDRLKGLSFLDRMQCLDIETWLVDDILVKLDRMSMAHSLEGRIPFLSEEMARFALTLPDEYRIASGRKKAVLRRKVETDLSRDVATRKKAGFSSPVSHWFDGVLKDKFVSLMEDQSVNAVIDGRQGISMLMDHVKRRDDNGFRLFAILCLAIWLKQNTRVSL